MIAQLPKQLVWGNAPPLGGIAPLPLRTNAHHCPAAKIGRDRRVDATRTHRGYLRVTPSRLPPSATNRPLALVDYKELTSDVTRDR
jgi:hypothetical protein